MNPFSEESPNICRSRDVQLLPHEVPALSWVEVLHRMLIAPLQTLEVLKNGYGNPADLDTPLLRQQILFTSAIIAIQVLCGLIFKGSVLLSPMLLILQIMGHFGLWLGLSGGIAYAYHVFTQDSKFGLLLTLTSASTIPWVLLPVVSLLKLGIPMLGIFAYAVLWVWTTILFIRSVAVVFSWSTEQLFVALSLPALTILWTYLMYFTTFFSFLH